MASVCSVALNRRKEEYKYNSNSFQERHCRHNFTFFPTYSNEPSTSPLAHHPPEVVEEKSYQDTEERDLFRNSSLGESPIFVVGISAVQCSSKHQIQISSCSLVLSAVTTHEPARAGQSRRSHSKLHQWAGSQKWQEATGTSREVLWRVSLRQHHKWNSAKQCKANQYMLVVSKE